MTKTATRTSDYTEDTLVEQPAIAIFEELGWETANAFDEILNDCPVTERDSQEQVVLHKRLLGALHTLNPDLPEHALQLAVAQLTQDRSTKQIVTANQEVYEMLKDGTLVHFKGPHGEDIEERVFFIDWDNPQNNDYFLVSQMWIQGKQYKRRPDLIGFVNGIPLVFIELKAIDRQLENAYVGNLRDYKDTIPEIFWYNAFIIISNGIESGMGTVTSPFEHFNEWKKIKDEDDDTEASLETMIRGTCEKNRLLDIIENFILFHKGKKGTEKFVARYHQYYGVNNAVESVRNIDENKGRLGVFWHTQGSGKSYSMVFFSQKVLRKMSGDYTFVVVTDRLELDDQIYTNFADSGVIYQSEEQVRAQNGEHLKQLLQEDHRYIFTIIHKFRTEHAETYPKLTDRSNIIVMTDEAHRTQYDILAQNMRDALPNAAFIGFTGTPLIVEEQLTRKVFGDYVSIYNFRQSVEDNATVPLYYENRTPKLQLTNEAFNEDVLQLIEQAELDIEQEEKLERYLRQKKHLITRDDRLEKVAEDIVEHFTSRGHQGKAMVISIDRLTAVRTYEKVQKYWSEKIDRLRGEIEAILASDPDPIERARADELIALAQYMKNTDMAVVISLGNTQNEVDDFRKIGIDILPHRRRMNNEDLDEKFKDADDPLRIVFVCAMWITGFDAKPTSTIYLDKPMRNHTLMQTIARANRVFRDKQNGIIVDYIGIFNNLQKALSIYGSSSGGGVEEGDMPIKIKEALVEELEKEVEAAEDFCRKNGVYPTVIMEAEGLDRGKLIQLAADAMLRTDKTKREFMSRVSSVNLLYRAVKPHEEAEEKFKAIRKLLIVIKRRIQAVTETADISFVMDDINDLLDQSVAAEPYVMPEDPVEHLTTDLSKIDFELLERKFRETRQKRTYMQRLRSITQARLRELILLNRTRIDYMKRLQQMIDDYNEGRTNVDQFFDALVQLTKELSDEEQRHVAENLTEEELAVFDLLTKPEPKLEKKDRELVKDVARDLLRVLHDKMAIDWRKTQQSRAVVKVTIRDVLDKLPDDYDRNLYDKKCKAVYQHVYESYWGEGQSVYAQREAVA